MKNSILLTTIVIGISVLVLTSFRNAPPTDKGLSERVAWLEKRYTPTGTIVAYGGTKDKIPEGWILCDGRALNKDGKDGRYRKLYDSIQTSWGDGSKGNGATSNVTNFNAPDLRGVFLRGVDSSDKKRDPDRSKRFSVWDDKKTQSGVGSYQSDAIQNIKGGLGHMTHDSGGTFKDSINGVFKMTKVIDAMGNRGGADNHVDIDFDASRVVRTSSETRPKNAYVNYIIKL